MAGLPGIGTHDAETNNDLKITQEDIKEQKKVSSCIADALLSMDPFVNLGKAMKEVRSEDTFNSNELDDLDHYHKLVVDGVKKQESLIFSFDVTRKVTETDFQELKSQYYKVLGKKLGQDRSQVAKLLKKRAAIKCHLSS